MKWHVYLGSTVIDSAVFYGDTIKKYSNCVFHPPIQAGDLIDLLPCKHTGVIICDGIYWTKPAIQIPEILYAIKSGITVVGVSSYGALRYADITEVNGMLGVGKICEMFKRASTIEDADVAVFHNDQFPFNSFSLPVVNIIQTIKELKMYNNSESRALLEYLRSIPIPQRTWLNMERWASQENKKAKLLVEAIKQNYQNQKYLDLLEALEYTKQHKFEKSLNQNNLSNWKPTIWLDKRLCFSKKYIEREKQILKERLGVYSRVTASKMAYAWLDRHINDNNFWTIITNPLTIKYIARDIVNSDASQNDKVDICRKYTPRYINILINYLSKD